MLLARPLELVFVLSKQSPSDSFQHQRLFVRLSVELASGRGGEGALSPETAPEMSKKTSFRLQTYEVRNMNLSRMLFSAAAYFRMSSLADRAIWPPRNSKIQTTEGTK